MKTTMHLEDRIQATLAAEINLVLLQNKLRHEENKHVTETTLVQSAVASLKSPSPITNWLGGIVCYLLRRLLANG